MSKKYIGVALEEEIERKINTIDIVRTSRIHKSHRLYDYSARWKIISFIMSISSIGFLIFSLIPQISKENTLALIIASVFSVYTIILQYYIETQNYNERALKLHYHQLKLEEFILTLKTQLRKLNDSKSSELEVRKKCASKYTDIMKRYQIEMNGSENHDEMDYNKAKRRGDSEKKNKYWDFSRDNLFIFTQGLVIPAFLIGYICLIVIK
jgi:hypothetical protein